MLGLLTYGSGIWRNKAGALALMALTSPVMAEQTDILALGDSLTQGYGVLDHEGFVPQLTNWLTARGHDVRIVNGGVSGDTTAGGLARAEWSLTPEIDAMIVALGGNDLLRGIAPEVARANLDGILTVARSRDLPVLLIGMEAPGNYGPDYKTDFDSMYPDLAAAYDTLYLPNFFAGLMVDGAPPQNLSDFMQLDGIHPNAAGVARIVEAVGPEVETLVERAND